jgi:steroid 5-alpha reductase family enzyme
LSLLEGTRPTALPSGILSFVLDVAVQLASLGAALGVMLGAWVASVILRDAGVADVAWGLAFVAVAWTAYVVGDGDPERSLLVAALVSAWGVRLAAHIAERRDGEDRRYAAMREKHQNFALRSLWSVFGTQALIAFVISAPIQVAATDSTPTDLGVLAWLGAALCAFGIVFEAVSDFQLRSFTKEPDSSGKVMDRGLWRYSRHPNYFGEVCVWWGIFLIALETGSGWWTAIGPALLTFLLLRVSGVSLTEKTISSRRPGYEDYVRRTSAFVPLPPKG